jgi:anti-sigma B factor antagonist
MEFNHNINDNVLELFVSGDLLGLSKEQRILDFVQEHIENQITRCSIDISDVGYMNSTGLSLLIRLLTRLRNQGGDLVLVSPSDQVKKLLVITKLNAIFSVVENQNEAIGFLQK